MFRAQISQLASGPTLKMEGSLVRQWAEEAKSLSLALKLCCRLPLDFNACSNSMRALTLASPSAICTRLWALISRLEDIKDYVAKHPELRNLFYPVPHVHGYAGVAANFVLHVNDLMNGKRRLARVPVTPPQKLTVAAAYGD